MSLAIMFPGQGSQTPGMGQELYSLRKEAKGVFEEASSATGVDLASLCFSAPEEELRKTENAQLALFTVSIACLRCLQSHIDGHVRIDFLAGHSVGEYAAVVAAGALTLAEGAKLVQRRGQLMANAGQIASGTMAAILGLERSALEKVLAEAEGIVVIANDNCPGQLVISGEVPAVQSACELAVKAGAKRALPLNVSGAFHSPLMEKASETLFEGLDDLKFKDSNATGPVFSNVTSEAVGRASEFPRLLQQGLRSPVRWNESVQNMVRDGATTFVECGSGAVLSGLLKRIDGLAKSLKVSDLATLEQTVAAIRP